MPHDEQPAHRFEARERIRHLGAMTRTPMGEYISSDHPLSQLGASLMFIGDACLEIAVPTPGPLDYDPKLQPSGVQYSILGKHATAKEERTNIGPGPAKYDVRGIRLPYSDTPHWSFGHKFPEQKVKDDTPSPFAYNDTHNTFGKNNLSYTISGRFSGSESETPGPDRYFPKAEFGPTGTMPKYSFGLKPLLIDDPTPGPHDYDVPTDPPDAPCGPSFTMRRRLDESFRNKDTKPGPNQYYPKIPASEKMASLKGMHKENKSLKTPGPANYIIPANLFSGPHYTLTARNIPFQDDVFVAPNPGPTDYNPDAHLTLNKAPTFSLGSRPKSSRHESDNIPGPGAYHPRDRQIRGNGNPKVTIKGRHKSHIDKTPGPADYNSHVPAVNPTAAQLARNEAGRPMGAERLKNVIEESPGPADYQLKPVSVVKPCGPKYSLRKRLESQKIDQTPGPNAYYALPKKNGGSTTMKSRASPFVMVFPTNRVDTLRV
ncbi:hypothetical protein HK105_206762 [Polyrhizophydium stewartii]|uniref:Uncharacterized protein n=1 Tax=Polyrhizophydium stewartii TaxID=2732419 RepID=A0ABR4N2H4_9FUNG